MIADDDIEAAARDVQIHLWKVEGSPRLTSIPQLMQLLRPQAAALAMGVSYSEVDTLGRFGSRGERYEIAGMFDRLQNRISVSRRFPSEVQRFTGAHELGHWVLHPAEHVHRDRPIREVGAQTAVRPLVERQADSFGACFLMPKRHVTDVFADNFGGNAFELDDQSAFELAGSRFTYLLRADTDSLELELALATAEKFRGKEFIGLARQFQVSPLSMALRIRELGLSS